ncbi:hypothetical protein HRbin20_01535 [bacterium HR20]|nr:hypothetical protein HRbin20_01535 [bacterium HR20]
MKVRFVGAVSVTCGGVNVNTVFDGGIVEIVVVSVVELTALNDVFTERKLPLPVPVAVIPIDALPTSPFELSSYR